jgi:hypothetical protein
MKEVWSFKFSIIFEYKCSAKRMFFFGGLPEQSICSWIAEKKKETKQLFYVLSLHRMWVADPDTALDKGQSRESQSGFVPFVMAPPG